MTITYPITLPSSPGARSSKLGPEDSVGVNESPFTFEQQVYENQGKRWKVEITMPKMRRSVAEQWIAQMMKLNSRKGTFLYGDPDAFFPQGVATGTPLVNGGSQVGIALNTQGWTHSVSGIMKAGDYFQLGSGSTARLYKLLDDVNSDSSGLAVLTNFWPPLRSSPANGATIVVQGAQTQFRLDDKFSWSADMVSTYEITFTASEAL